MELQEEEMDLAQLRNRRTRELIGHAVAEAKAVARAEVLHARAELEDEAKNAKWMVLFAVPALGLALCALAVLFVLIALALPLPPVAALAIVFGALAVCVGVLAALVKARIPKKPMGHTRARLARYLEVREELRH